MSQVAERYARAFFALARESGDVATLKGAMDRLGHALEASKALREALMNPLVDRAAKIRIAFAIAQAADPMLEAFLALVEQKGRIGDLAEVARRFVVLADESEGVVEARLESVVGLSEAELKRVGTLLERRFHKKIRIAWHASPELLGGIRVVLQDEVLDLSLATELRKLGQRMRSEGARKAGDAS